MPVLRKSLIALAVSTACSLPNLYAKSDVKKGEKRLYIVQLNGDTAVEHAKRLFKQKNDKQAAFKFSQQKNLASNYRKHLANERKTAIANASKLISESLNPVFEYDSALNGFAVYLTDHQASKVKSLPRVKSVLPSLIHKAHTDRGPARVNAPSAWDGSATGTPAKGEGIVVGVIDTGINHDHPSFSAIDPVDGYNHTNPLGSGNYLGDCVSTPSLCNDKLIGSWNFVDGETSPEDTNGHGTHVAATAAGNNISFDLGNGNSWNLSGVAPRANIINYRIGGEEGSASGAAISAAIDQAINDGVDVINYSFGSSDPFADPWGFSGPIAYRNAREAGIFVATSAGNDGSNPTTVGSPANAPWLTTVAASTHDRDAFPDKTMSGFTGGSGVPPTLFTGRGMTGPITAPVVYAGDFSNGDTNPEQCLTPFPANTFTGQIVVCDRGEIARVEKAQNVAAGGAGGFVLANITGGSDSLNDDPFVIPGIHISSTDGNSLKAWLNSGSGHQATINGTNGNITTDENLADIIADFSSRGPNGYPADVIKPSVAAPGVSIFAADIAPTEYFYKSGTSMASPHVAGAAAIIRQLKPAWSPSQIHSALVTTGVTAMRKEDASNPADVFDMGGGRIDISNSLNAGLLLSETNTNFINANPSDGGDPSTLNLPSIADDFCLESCTFERTMTAAVSDSWTSSVQSDNEISINIAPENFTLVEGINQTVDIDVSVNNGIDGEWYYGSISFSPGGAGISSTRIPVAIRAKNSNLDTLGFEFDSQRDAFQTTVSGITTTATNSLTSEVYLTPINNENASLAEDSDNSSAFDSLTDGVTYSTIDVPSNAVRLLAQTSSSTAPDIDLFVGFDSDNNGLPSENELLRSSRSSDANEEVALDNPPAGTYWVLTQNWAGSTAATDSVEIKTALLTDTSSTSASSTAPTSSNGVDSFESTISWSGLSTQSGEWLGALALSRGTSSGDLGKAFFTINRVNNDVNLSAGTLTYNTGDNFSFSVSVAPNTSEMRNYTIDIDIPSGMTVDANALDSAATLNGSTISWNPSVTGGNTSLQVSGTIEESAAGQQLVINASHDVDLPSTLEETSSLTLSVRTNSTTPPPTSGGSSGGGALWILLAFLPFLRGRRKK